MDRFDVGEGVGLFYDGGMAVAGPYFQGALEDATIEGVPELVEAALQGIFVYSVKFGHGGDDAGAEPVVDWADGWRAAGTAPARYFFTPACGV